MFAVPGRPSHQGHAALKARPGRVLVGPAVLAGTGDDVHASVGGAVPELAGRGVGVAVVPLGGRPAVGELDHHRTALRRVALEDVDLTATHNVPAPHGSNALFGRRFVELVTLLVGHLGLIDHIRSHLASAAWAPAQWS